MLSKFRLKYFKTTLCSGRKRTSGLKGIGEVSSGDDGLRAVLVVFVVVSCAVCVAEAESGCKCADCR